MNELEFSFEESPWERLFGTLGPGQAVSAAQLLTLVEDEDELEEALAELEERELSLDVSRLPRGFSGEGAVRLRQEQQLVSRGLPPEELEENDPLRLYLEDVAGIPAFGDESLLAQRCAQGEPEAMNALTNLGLSRVIDLAKVYVGYGTLLLDLIQEGNLGLCRAISEFRSGDWGSWRDRYVRLALAKVVTHQALASGIGEKMRAALEDYRAVDERLLAELGRNPTLEEIAAELHMSAEEASSVKKMLDDAQILAKIKRPEPEETPEEENQAVEDTAQFQMRQRILDLLSGLSEQDAKLLTLRFGLEGGQPMSPEEAGRRLGLTPDEVVAKESAALQQLRGGK